MIFLLGIDGLDYELVESLNLNNLKQLEYSKIVVPINEERGIPFSPEVWAAFLVGEHMSMNFVSSSSLTTAIIKFIEFFHIDLDKGLVKKIKHLFNKLYDFSAPNRFCSLNRETFLDITKSMEINVPFYSFDNKTFDIGYLFGKGELSLGQTVKGIKLIYESRKKQVFSEIDSIENEKIVFAFMHATDMLQHCAYLRFSEIEQHYIGLDNYVMVLKRRLKDSFGEIIFIIVSDHGFDFNIGDHSNYAFYSSNTHLMPKPEKITDFYEIILNYVNKSNELSSSKEV